MDCHAAEAARKDEFKRGIPMSHRFELPAELTIYSVMETRDSLLAWVEKAQAQTNAPLEISARDVEAVDGSGLQLLAALGSMEVTWWLVQTSPVFTEACHTLGLSQWLDNPYIAATQETTA
jgi:anti-anti-sigma regulatory factor